MAPPAGGTSAREVIATELHETLVVEAVAGTGKTTALISRIAAIIRSGTTALHRMVAVTFTEKAAGTRWQERSRVTRQTESRAQRDHQ